MENQYKDKENILVINSNKYVILRTMGKGGFGTIYESYECTSKKKFAIKSSSNKEQLMHEFKIYQLLHQDSSSYQNGIPHVFDFQQEKDQAFMVLQLLGDSVQTRHEKLNSKMDFRTTLTLGYRMLSIIEYVHSKGIVHRDLSPDNFLFGLEEEKENLFLVDFGLAKSYLLENGDHIPFNPSVSFVGTERFASKYATARLEYCRREEIASLCYILIYLAKGSLPWDDFEADIPRFFYYCLAMKKANVTNEELYGELPFDFQEMISKMLNHAHQIPFADKPDYDFCKQIIYQTFGIMGYGLL